MHYIIYMMFDRKIHTQVLKNRFDSVYLDGSQITPAELINEMVSTVDISSGTCLVMFDYAMALALVEAGAKYVTVAVSTVNPKMNVWAESVGFTIQDFRDIEEQNLSFDVIIANPPYQGKKELHQAFFNIAVDLLRDDGQMVFIQPATPYLNNKEGRVHQQAMRENVKKYTCTVKMINGSIFQNAVIGNTLAITNLIKTPSNTNTIETVTFEDGRIYENVDLSEINMNGMSRELYKSIRAKIETYIDQNGSLFDIQYRNDSGESDYVCSLSRARGHMGNNDFYTFLPQDINHKSHTKDVSEKTNFGIKVTSNEQVENIYGYLRTYVARGCVSLAKCTIMNMGELKIVPRVDFNRSWNDEQLCELFGLTDEEFAEIKRVIPSYYEGI